jgi:hypothetical protein
MVSNIPVPYRTWKHGKIKRLPPESLEREKPALDLLSSR